MTAAPTAPAIPVVTPIAPLRRETAFSDPKWIFEPKYDGFRAVAYVAGGQCTLVSRKGNFMVRFNELGCAVAAQLGSRAAIIDGEIVVLDEHGRPRFLDLMNRRGAPSYVAFDLLWLDGVDLRQEPLLHRKSLLAALPLTGRLHAGHYVEGAGIGLFQATCALDMEGIVAKRHGDPYSTSTVWYKIKNRTYSQSAGRQELFNGRSRVKRD